MERSIVEERRTSYRLPFSAPFLCRLDEEGGAYSGILRNVSITGCHGTLEKRLPVGAACTLQIIFPGSHSRLNVEGVRGRVVRSDEEGLAVRFDQRLEWFVLIPLFYQKICGHTLELPIEIVAP